MQRWISGIVIALTVAGGAAAQPGAPEAEQSGTAIVIVVENNQKGLRPADDAWDHLDRWLDTDGEPLYGEILRRVAAPRYDEVVVLTDDEARFDRFRAALLDLHDRGYVIDVLLDIHGSSRFTELGNDTLDGPDRLWFTGRGVTTADIEALAADGPLRLNGVYLVSCWGSRFNDAWRKAGAKAVNGARELNYYVLVSPVVFLAAWTRGLDMKLAADIAYRAERLLLGRRTLERLLADRYGAEGVTRVDTARSSERHHAGENIRAARFHTHSAGAP
jgi:hypothetical protein